MLVSSRGKGGDTSLISYLIVRTYVTCIEAPPPLAEVAVQSKAVVMLLLICCLCTSHYLWGFCVCLWGEGGRGQPPSNFVGG